MESTLDLLTEEQRKLHEELALIYMTAQTMSEYFVSLPNFSYISIMKKKCKNEELTWEN